MSFEGSSTKLSSCLCLAAWASSLSCRCPPLRAQIHALLQGKPNIIAQP
uniref:Uncharacterized protein n=1 Tax=Arundo donax TaxID=35708 RepID=A0A0A9H1H7_ARUDO